MKQILCFGDSNTYGLVPQQGGRFEWGIRWTSLLDKKIKKKGYRVIEEGLCGRTTVFHDPLRDGRRGAELLPVLLEAHNPIHIVVLMLGTNDCKVVYDASAEIIGRGIERLLDQIQKFDENIKVLLVSPIELGHKIWEEGFDPEFDEKSVITSKNLPKVYEKIAKRRNTYFLAASDYAKPSENDREHLDQEGHKALADAVGEKIEEIIKS